MNKYGWIRDSHDERDLVFAVTHPLALPQVVDLRPSMPAVYDQGNIGACSANALAAAMQFMDRVDHNDSDPEMVSRLFIYYGERALEGTTDQDSGAMLRDGIKTLHKQGVCTEALWPYRANLLTVKPTPETYVDAHPRQITSYQRIIGLPNMLQCLAQGFPFVFGFEVFQSFESEDVARSGIVPMPKRGEAILGGHAVLAVGFDLSMKQFIVRNSWGDQWGMKGYCKMPFAYLANHKLADDCWVIKR